MKSQHSGHKKGISTNWILAVFIVLFLASPLLSMRLNPNDYEGGRSRDVKARNIRNRSAIAVVLGELRASMSDMLFIKTELYLHSGVSYQLNLDYDALSSKGQVKDIQEDHQEKHAEHGHEVHDYEHEHEHERDENTHEHEGHEDHDHALPSGDDDLHFQCQGADTVIRTPEQDFRGIVGKLHRKVKPWLDPSEAHKHTSGKELLPWYRLMTLSDPHNVRGYMIGAWWLKRQRTDTQLREAKNFLEEGIKHNPEAFQLYLMHGHVMRALEDNIEAKESYRKAAERAIKKRPPEGTDNPDWTDYNEEDAMASIRLAVFAEKDFGSKRKALEMARRYLKAIGEDHILERQIRELSDQIQNESKS